MTYHRVREPKSVVVIFKTQLRDGADKVAYAKASRRMRELVETIPGFVSIKAYKGDDGEEIDIVRFQSEAGLEAWRNQPEHRKTQDRGRREFYDYYHVEACKVIRDYEFTLRPARRSRRAPSQSVARR